MVVSSELCLTGWSATLAAAPATNSGGWIALLICVCALIIVVATILINTERQKRAAMEREFRGIIAEQNAQVESHKQRHDQRENVMYEQHKKMNDLQVAKLAAEVELLQRQVKSHGLDQDRIEAGKEYHELMVEKTKLEMDSLRLHIAEMRKRLEDWRSD